MPVHEIIFDNLATGKREVLRNAKNVPMTFKAIADWECEEESIDESKQRDSSPERS
jgi:hypothetical protein